MSNTYLYKVCKAYKPRSILWSKDQISLQKCRVFEPLSSKEKYFNYQRLYHPINMPKTLVKRYYSSRVFDHDIPIRKCSTSQPPSRLSSFPRATMRMGDYETQDDGSLLYIVTSHLREYIEELEQNGAEGVYASLRSSLTPNQRWVYSFVQSDTILSHETFLCFFYKGGGEYFDDLCEGLLHIKDAELYQLIRRAVSEIEEPNRWKLFTELKDILEDDIPKKMLNDEKLCSIFDPLDKMYKNKRKIAEKKIAELVRKNIDDFIILL